MQKTESLEGTITKKTDELEKRIEQQKEIKQTKTAEFDNLQSQHAEARNKR
jgi:hypothetical protein